MPTTPGKRETNTSFNMPISTEMGLTQCSIIQIIHHDLGQKCLLLTNIPNG